MSSFLSKPAVSKLLLGTAAFGVGWGLKNFEIYLNDHPLSAARSATIKSSRQLSPSFASSSQSFSTIVNPRNHMGIADSYQIRLSKADIRERSDEEILATFTRGFFAGWIFTPERYLIASLRSVGLKFLPCGFSRIPSPGPLLDLESVSSRALPPPHSLLFGGSFMVLFTKSEPDPLANSPSCVEIGFGDDRKQFSGMHSFELIHEDDGVTIWYSSVSCNPMVDRPLVPDWAFSLHRFYARSLFRDGIAAVLKSE
ncbi:hypothetical protein NHQ30_005479 [Ciborinia camelliae]|nr:hypothetical protein NHQ30_005479 [Ciborinia camelliae]